ncbi:3-deoxy-7-phosphoheptulonate synthase, partial [Rhizobium ruizarguesonis]
QPHHFPAVTKDGHAAIASTTGNEDCQDLVPGKPLVYGQSITDGCIDWDMSVSVLEDLATSARERRRTRV